MAKAAPRYHLQFRRGPAVEPFKQRDRFAAEVGLKATVFPFTGRQAQHSPQSLSERRPRNFQKLLLLRGQHVQARTATGARIRTEGSDHTVVVDRRDEQVDAAT